MPALCGADEAFFVAQEMEKRAIRLYERALMVFEDASVRREIGEILTDEREHLCRFQSMSEKTCPSADERALLSARAGDMLFSGGLVEAQRRGALSSPKNLLIYAAGEEQNAVDKYSAFAAQMTDKGRAEAAAAFSAIAREEKTHLSELNARIAAMN